MKIRLFLQTALLATVAILCAQANAQTPVINGGTPQFVTRFDLTGQTASFAVQTIYTVPGPAAMYRVYCFIIVTTPATTSSTMPSCTLWWTDEVSQLHINGLTSTSAANALGTNTLSDVNTSSAQYFYAKSGSAIRIATGSYASSGATAMQYALHVVVERVSP